jgi:hypothetical protein
MLKGISIFSFSAPSELKRQTTTSTTERTDQHSGKM